MSKNAKGTVIQPMKETDFIQKQGTVKTTLERAVVINDTTQNITVTQSFNHKKGAFNIVFTWNMNAVTGDDTKDTATLESAMKLMMTSRNQCLAERDEWRSKNVDQDQLKMEFGKTDGDEE